jgi:hypothetical protein
MVLSYLWTNNQGRITAIEIGRGPWMRRCAFPR